MSKPLHTWKIAVTTPLSPFNATPSIPALVWVYQVFSGWHLKQIEEWLLQTSMCAVVCSYCMSHQHLDAKIVKNFP